MGKSGRESHWKRGQEKRIRAFSDISLPSGLDPRVQSSGTVFNEREQEIYNDLSVAADEAKVELEKPDYELYGEGVLVGTVLPKKLPKNKTELGKLVSDTYTKADMDNLSSWYMTGDLKAKELHGKPKSLALIRRELGQIVKHKGYSSIQHAKLFNRYIEPLTASIVEVYNSGSRNGISREVMDDEVGPLSQRLFKNIQHILINIPPDSRKESTGVYNENMNGEPKLQIPAELGKVVPANPKNVGPEMHAEEVSETFFDFPEGRLKLKGKPSKETLLQYIRPRLGKVYKEIGLTEDKVNSALKKVFATDDTGAIIEEVQRILRNVDFEKSRTTSPVYRENPLTTEIPSVSIEPQPTTIKPSSEVESLPTSVGQTGEVQPAVEIKPDSNAQLVRLSKAQKKKIRGHDAYRAEQEDKWYRDPNEDDGGLDDYEQQQIRKRFPSIPTQDGVINTLVEPKINATPSIEKVVERMSRQMDTIRNRTRGMREGLGLSHKEAMAQVESFSDSRKNVRRIREKLKRIVKDGDFDVHAEEVQTLRDQLAKELRDFRKYGAVDAKVNESLTTDFEAMAQDERSFENNKQRELRSGDIVSAYVTDGVRVEAVVRSIPGSGLVAIGWEENGKYRTATVPSELLTFVREAEVVDSVIAEKSAEYIAGSNEDIKDESTLPTIEKKEYEKRFDVREDWKKKRTTYENEYKKYLEEQSKKTWKEKLQFWKNENQPEVLKQAQEAYTESRKEYSGLLKSALDGRAAISSRKRVEDPARPESNVYKTERDIKESIGAGLANRFVIASAEARLALEKEVLLQNPNTNRIFEKLTESDRIKRFVKFTREYRKSIGYVTAFGVGIASGGLVGVVQALLGRAVRTQAALYGGVVGATVGRFISEENIASKKQNKDASANRVRIGFNRDMLDELEATYFNDALMLETAKKRAKYIVGGSALLGSFVGSAIAGGLADSESISGQQPVEPQVKADIPGRQSISVVGEGDIQNGVNVIMSEQVAVPDTAEPTIQEGIVDQGVEGAAVVPESKVIPSPYTFEQAQALKAPYISENFMYPHKLADGSYREATPAEIASGDYLPLVEDQVVVDTDGGNIESEPRTYRGVDDEGYEGDEEHEEEEEPGAGQSTEGYPEAPIIPDISFESGQPVFFMPPHTGMNQILDTHAEWYYNYNHDQGNPVAIDENISRTDFVTNASHLQEAMKMYPEDYARVFDAMEIPSHNFDDVRVGQKIRLEPFFELLKYYKE